MSQKLSKVLGFCLLGVYVFFLLFDFKIVNIALIALFLFVLWDWNNKKQKMRFFFQTNANAFLVIGVFFLFQLLHGLFFHELGEKRFGLLALMLLSFIALSWLSHLHIAVHLYLLAMTIIEILGLANIYVYYLNSETFNLVEGGHINEMLIVNRPVLGFLLAVGILLCMYMYRISRKQLKWFYGGLSIFFLMYIVLIGNRIQMVSLLLILLMYVLFYLKVGGLSKALFLIVMALGVGVASTFYFSGALKKRFELIGLSESKHTVALEEREPRVVIWRCAMALARDENFNMFVGLGKGHLLEDKLALCYDSETKNNRLRSYFMNSRFGTHNQFIEYYLLTGVFGLLTFVGIFVYFGSVLRKYFIPTALLILLVNFCMVDNILNVQQGAYLFGFILWLALSTSHELKTERGRA